MKIVPVTLGLMLVGPTSAFAGGGFLDGASQAAYSNTPASASGSGSSQFSGQFGSGASTVFVSASAQGGETRSVSISGGGNNVVEKVQGRNIDVTMASGLDGVIFEKGGNLIAKGVAGATVQLTINGQQYVVSRDIAIALARSTQFGSSAAVAVEGSIVSNSYSPSPVQSSKGTSR